jgi:ABC-2 type transport system permease protein/lipopolysaccharide transport system permease protein
VALKTGSGAPPGRPLPEVWLHRTARSARYGALDGDQPRAGGARPGLARTIEVLRVLTRTDFRARYRAQALGVVWSLLNPLVMMGILSLVFTRVFRTATPNFPIFVLIGLVCWQWITNGVTAGTQSFVGNADLVKRTVFAREALPIASVLSYGVNFLVESLIVVAFVPIFPDAFRLSPALALVPIYLALLALLIAGVSLATSVLNVIYRDVAYIVSTALGILYWLTPVMYPLEVIPRPYRTVLEWNPAGAILEALRGTVMRGQAPGAQAWAAMVLPTAAALAIGWLLFRRNERLALDHV